MTLFWVYSAATGAAAVVIGERLADALRGLLPHVPVSVILTVALVGLAGLLHDRALSAVTAARRR